MPNSHRTLPYAASAAAGPACDAGHTLQTAEAAAHDALMQKFIGAFRFQVASSQEDIDKALALRHEVFIQELGYHMREKEGAPLETDGYDDTSVHCILIHRPTGKTAGCFRIVTTKAPGGKGFNKLPVEAHGSAGISHATLHPRMLPQEQICEASRLAIARGFRLKTNADDTPLPQRYPAAALEETRDTYPLILVSLFLAAYSLAEILGNRHLYAMMSPTLPRLLRKSGFDFVRLGDAIEFHGKRNVFYINRSLAGSGLQHTLYPLHQHIYRELERQITDLPSAELTSRVAR